MMARDAHERALKAKQQAEANNQEAERQRELAERSEHIARKAEEMALAAQNDAVEAAARSQGAEDVVAELVRSMFVNAHHLSDVEQNLDARYALHWAMAALAQITNSRDERISNLDECIRLAEQRVGLLEAEFPDSGSGPDIKVIGELSIARSRLLRAKRELANLADRQTRQAALKANVLNHLEWWRRVHTYAMTGRRGGETYHEDEAARRLYLAMSEAVAEGIELEELDTDGLLTDDIKAARPDRQELLELAVAAGESVCKANQLRWDRAIHRRGREGKVDEAWAAAIPEIMEGLAELARARIALAQLIQNPDGHRAGLESQAAVLQEYIEGLVQLDSSEADALTRAAIDFVKSHHALVELQLMRFGTTRSFP